MTYKEVPKPARDTFPRTFGKYEPYCKEELPDWFAVILSLIASAQNMAAKADEKQLLVIDGNENQPIAQVFLSSLLTAENIDALCLERDEWDKAVPNPDVTRNTMNAILSMGLNGLRGTPAVNPWLNALNRVAKGTGWVFIGSVGGEIVVELMDNIGNTKS